LPQRAARIHELRESAQLKAFLTSHVEKTPQFPVASEIVIVHEHDVPGCDFIRSLTRAALTLIAEGVPGIMRPNHGRVAVPHGPQQNLRVDCPVGRSKESGVDAKPTQDLVGSYDLARKILDRMVVAMVADVMPLADYALEDLAVPLDLLAQNEERRVQGLFSEYV
jgi:hypothetical protein